MKNEIDIDVERDREKRASDRDRARGRENECKSNSIHTKMIVNMIIGFFGQDFDHQIFGQTDDLIFGNGFRFQMLPKALTARFLTRLLSPGL